MFFVVLFIYLLAYFENPHFTVLEAQASVRVVETPPKVSRVRGRLTYLRPLLGQRCCLFTLSLTCPRKTSTHTHTHTTEMLAHLSTKASGRVVDDKAYLLRCVQFPLIPMSQLQIISHYGHIRGSEKSKTQSPCYLWNHQFLRVAFF